MNKHINKTEDTHYRVVVHPEDPKRDTQFHYYENLDKAREAIVKEESSGVGYTKNWGPCEIWIEEYKKGEWVEVDE